MAEKLTVWVCEACGAKWFVANVHGSCPSCSHTKGVLKNLTEEELRA